MKKKILINNLISLTSLPIAFAPVVLSAQCNSTEDDIFNLKNNDKVKTSNIFYKTYLSQLQQHTLTSLYESLQNKIITLNLDEKVSEFKISNNKNDIEFKYKSKWYSLKTYANKIANFNFDEILKPFTYITKNNKFSVIRANRINNPTDIDILFAFSLDDNHNLLAYEYKKLIFQKVFDKGILGDYSIPNLQYLIYKAITLPSQKFKLLTSIKNIRAKGFFNAQYQHRLLEKRLLDELSIYNFEKNGKKIKDVKIKNLKIKNSQVSFNVDLLSEDGNSLLSEEQKKQFFAINGFSNGEYSNYKNLHDGKNLMIDPNKTLFSELLNMPELLFKSNPLNYHTIDDLMHPTKEYEKYNLNSLNMLISELKDEIEIINSEDKFNFKIGTFEKTNLLNNSYSIGKLEIKDPNTNSKYDWYSINFTKHNHIMTQGFYLVNELGKIDQSNKNSYFSYYNNNGAFDANHNLALPTGTKAINANDFVKKSFNDIVNFLIYQHIDNLQLWDNNSMFNCSVYNILKNKTFYEKWLSIIISQYVLLYNINNDSNESGLIKKVTVNIISPDKYDAAVHGLGNLPIEIDFINNNNKSMLNKKHKFILTGFKGYDKNEIEKAKALFTNDEYKSSLPLENKTLPFLISHEWQ
ncbi:MAG3240 family lipoprotein [Mycoplasmopsis primatum]|uniref:MAG3240 family lipoprotein n=1 Tax=Mycoplasmopsis primatum TaxID=55604 RepID=UPI000496B5EE|nr:hypothetical protein [Mycoplasmopsis primatum]